MRTKLFITLALAVAILLCPVTICAQQTSSAAENKQTADEALREKAFDLLKSLAGQLSTLQSAENRARIGSNIAGSLWTHDEKRARDLFAFVAEDIKAGLEPPEGHDDKTRHTFAVFLKLRADTIERIAKHDPELAYTFFKATQLSSKPYRTELLNEEHEREMHLAKQIARSSPDIALELARKSMSREFSFSLRELLSQLNRNHKEQALILYKEIVQKLGQVDFAEDWSAQSFALNLVMTFTPPAADESTFRELVGLFIKAAVANGCTGNRSDPDYENLCQMIGNVLPHIRRVDPARAAQLKRWDTQNPNVESRPSLPYYELYDLAANGTVEEIVAFASQYPAFEDHIFQNAITTARARGDFERARNIASDFRGNPEKRRLMLADLDADLKASVDEEKLAEAQKRLNEITQPAKQVSFLVSLATVAGISDRKIALKLLNQASEIVDAMKPGSEQVEAQVGLAIAYCSEKNDRGLAIMESVVPKLNELVEAAAKLDGYDTNYLREGEWNMSGEGRLGHLLTALAQKAGYFAWCDFDRAVSLAGQFERAEIRMMAQLKLAQGVLGGRPRRLHAGH